MTEIIKYSSGTKWEESVGYSRAIRVGNIIEVSGTTAVENNKVVYEGDGYNQTKFILQKIEKALQEVGSNINEVIRTRMYVTDISMFEEYTRAHCEFFKSVQPTTTLVEVRALVNPKMLIEIEVTAVSDKH